MKQGIRKFFLITSLISGGFIFYEHITIGFGIASLYIGFPIFVISSLITIFISTDYESRLYNKRMGGFIMWLSSITILFSILIIINKIRNISPVLFATEFYWEEGVDIQFRKNGTFKAVNHDMLSSDLSYGEYEIKDSLIILKDKLKFGLENMKDTLHISNNGIEFQMQVQWRINGGQMTYKYQPKTEVNIVNNTKNQIDSLFIKTYTTEKISEVSIEPFKNIKYKFDMKNPHVNGKYRLSFKINGHMNQYSNILSGYPLESVAEIQFEENEIRLNLIFGNTITINY